MSQTSTPHGADAERLAISPHLLELLVCPVDHAALRPEGEGLVCTQCRRGYAVRDGIPSMVVDEVPA